MVSAPETHREWNMGVLHMSYTEVYILSPDGEEGTEITEKNVLMKMENW